MSTVTSLPTKLVKEKNLEAEAREKAYATLVQLAEDFRDNKVVALVGVLFAQDGGHSTVSACTGKLSVFEVIGALEAHKAEIVLDAITSDEDEDDQV